MAEIAGKSLGYVSPFGKAFAPSIIILFDRMILGEIEGKDSSLVLVKGDN